MDSDVQILKAQLEQQRQEKEGMAEQIRADEEEKRRLASDAATAQEGRIIEEKAR